jgi:hypothetical protein
MLRRRNFVEAAIAKPIEWSLCSVQDLAMPCDWYFTKIIVKPLYEHNMVLLFNKN